MASSRGRDGGRRGVDGMARGAGEPSAKRAKVDEADEKEEEDPLVRRKEEVVRLLERARAKGKERHSLDWYRWVCDTFERARAKEELLTLCTRLEAKNEKNLTRLPPEMWQKILDGNLHQNDLLAFAMTCRFFREKQKDLGKNVETKLAAWRLLKLRNSGEVASHSLGWFRWVCDTFEIRPGEYDFRDGDPVEGVVYEGNLLNYAAFRGSVEILRWLMEEKGWELNESTDYFAGQGGSIDVFEYLLGRGHEFNEDACHMAARGGHPNALKFLRGLDPPCPWSAFTCLMASDGAHLDVLKWLRAQNPPCPWDRRTCANAVLGGRLEVLKWARSQDPPCPWSRSKCRSYAYSKNYQHVIDWIDQQEDESDDESVFSDSDSDRSYDSYDDEYF